MFSSEQDLTDTLQRIVFLVFPKEADFVINVVLGHVRISQVEHLIAVAQVQQHVT